MCTLFILICLACTYFVCCSTINSSEYIAFAVQWKPQFCYKNTAPNCHTESIPNITIHGIWPNSYNGSYPSYCPGPALQTKDVETIQEDLEIYWPTLSNSDTNFGFWSYQWKKHGKCWYSVNATQYFEYGISWMKTDYKHIQDILATDGIYPSNENQYLLENVTNSLHSGLNQKSVVRCKNGKYISEFFVCRNFLTGEKTDCPNNLLSNCNENVILSLQVLPDTVLPTTTIPVTTAYNHNLTAPIWINELHYDNAGTDVDEFVEIAGIAGTDLSDYMIYLYNGATGEEYGQLSFSQVTNGSIPDQQNGVGTAFIAINGIQNGGADGIALVYYRKYVMQFLSYEGQFVAVDGPVKGMESVDIGVAEGSNTIINTSLSLVGSGYEYEDFEWKSGVIATPGRINIGQIITSTLETTYKPKSTDFEETYSDFEETDGSSEETVNPKPIDVVLIVIGCVVLIVIVFASVIYFCRNKGNVGMQQVPMNDDMDDDIDDDTETDTQIELIGND